MDYFYTTPQHISRQELTIDGEEFIHLTHVMRREVGDEVRVVDGQGSAYDVRIAEISKRTARCVISAHHRQLNEPGTHVTLAVAILKNASRFDFLVEKTTEIGVSAIVPLLTERTIPRHARTDRWQKLAIAAMKQSGRCVLPVVKELTSFPDFVRSLKPDPLKLLLHEKSGTSLISVKPKNSDDSGVIVCIGPEGGFTDEEIALASSSGFKPVGLGPRRLRTETAAVAAAGLVLVGV